MKHEIRRRSDNHRFDYERLRFAINASGLHIGLFARRIGLPDSDPICNVLLGREPLTPALARRIHACYPQISLEWLTTGLVGGAEPPAFGRNDV